MYYVPRTNCWTMLLEVSALSRAKDQLLAIAQVYQIAIEISGVIDLFRDPAAQSVGWNPTYNLRIASHAAFQRFRKDVVAERGCCVCAILE